MYKSKKGITLIALVVTIIVLLILAGISISMLTGQNRNTKQSSASKRWHKLISNKRRNSISNNKCGIRLLHRT